LKRLGLEHRISKYFKSDEIIPAAGQGALAVEFRKDDKKTFSILKKIQDESTQICINEERKFLKSVGGGCSSPDAALCIINGDNVEIKGKVFDAKEKKYISGKMIKEIGNHIDIGEKLAKKLMSKISNKISTQIILTNEGDISGFNELSKSDIIIHHFPLIEISPLDFTVNNIEKYDYIIFTSKNGVKNFFNRVKVSSDMKFICIGNKTNQVLNEYGYESAYISKRNYSDIMAEELKNNKLLNRKKTLLIQGKIAKDDFKIKLQDFCEIERVNVYETNLKNKVNKELLKLIESKETYTVFTSPSAFDSFIQFYNPEDTKIISIGKTTTDYVNSKGFDCMLTSKMQSYEGISKSLIKYFYQK
jgi:uroporphyrinogen-III synthase